MLEVINQDYIRTAYAKGLPERMVLLGHALKNASLPLVTIIGLDLPILISGAVVTESIFAWPGMGRLFWDAVQDTDIPVLMAILVIVAFLVVIFQILTDIAYTFLDPRIRYS
jgi:peptide/nickel transport system permease protein